MTLFFGVGAQRTGSTLLTRILNAHSQIAAPFEIPLAQYSLGTTEQNIQLDKIIQIGQLIGADPSLILKDPHAFLDAIRAYEKKDALVVKGPSNTCHLPRILMDFGDVPLIHIVRDARQVCMSESLLKVHGGSVAMAMRHWFQYNLEVLRHQKYFSRVHVVRYEDLVAAPEKVVSGLLDFMGYEFEPGMLDYWKAQHSDDKLQLWDGMPPTESTWSRDLYQKQIKGQFRKPTAEVLEIYETNRQLRQMNARFGYR